MAFEPTPAVVYSPEPDLGAVLEVLRSTPGLLDLRADGPDDDWREIRLTIDDPNAVRRVLVRNDPSLWQRPGFDTQLAGMQQFLARHGVDARTGPMIESLSELGFAISLSGDDGQRHPYLHDDDPAGRLTKALAHRLDGVVFWISGLFDADARLLLGGTAQHPQATPPDWMADPPSPSRVARRFLVLLALHLRAQLEYLDEPSIDREYERSRLLDWIATGGFAEEFEPHETSPHVPCGELSAQPTIDDWWRLEGAVVLAWALGLAPPSSDAPSDAAEELATIAGWPNGVPAGLVDGATMRSDDELRAAQTHQFFWHWRFVDHRVNPRALDFAELGRSSWFGNFADGEFRLVDGDLAVGDRSISDADPNIVAGHASAAAERHTAFNWLRGGRSYGDTQANT